ncbi:hypothetical protein D3C80_1451030 [compost metagenome]
MYPASTGIEINAIDIKAVFAGVLGHGFDEQDRLASIDAHTPAQHSVEGPLPCRLHRSLCVLRPHVDDVENLNLGPPPEKRHMLG